MKEGHYIGNLWSEQNSDVQPAAYASQRGAAHIGLQPLLTEFANSFRKLETSFLPSANPVGAIWYKTILQSTTCPDNGLGGFYSPPSGASVGLDNINWAVVLPSNGASYTIQFTSNGGAVGGVLTGKPGKITKILIVSYPSFRVSSKKSHGSWAYSMHPREIFREGKANTHSL